MPIPQQTNSQAKIPKAQPLPITSESDAFTKVEKQNTNMEMSKNDKEKKKQITSSLLLAITTILIAIAVPITIFGIKQGQDIRGRASETATPPPYPTFFPSPSTEVSGCNQTCSSHADCQASYFCSDEGICKNALCSEQADCVCN